MKSLRTTLRWCHWLVVAALGIAYSVSSAQASGASVTASFSGLVYNRATQTFNSVLTLTNNGPTLYAPLSISISTNVATVTVSGASSGGVLTLSSLPNGTLLPNAAAQVVVAFVDPTRVAFVPTVTQVIGASAPGAPTAVIDAPSAVVAYSTVVLDGTSSGDPTASIQSYAWTQAAGPTVTLTGANTAQASFITPQVTALTPFTFRLTVTDSTGTVATATTTINVSVASAAQLAVTFVAARMLAPVPANPHTNFAPADGPPLAGASSTIQVTLTGAVQSPAFTLVDGNGNLLSALNLAVADSPSIQPITFFGPITVPTVPFAVAASGRTADGQTFAVRSPVLFTPMNMSIGFSPFALFLAPGSTGDSQLTIYNGGGPATYTIQFNDPNSLLSSSQPISVQIAASSSATIPVTVAYPAAASGIVEPTVTATASVGGDPSRVGNATLTLWPMGAQ